MRRPSLIPTLLAGCVLQTLGHAAELADETSAAAQTVVVSATRIERSLSDAPVRTEVVGRYELTNIHARSLKEALEQADDAALVNIIQGAIAKKPETHCFDEGFLTEKNMSRIGG